MSGMELRSSGFVASTFAHVSLNVDGTGAWEMKGSVLGIQGRVRNIRRKAQRRKAGLAPGSRI